VVRHFAQLQQDAVQRRQQHEVAPGAQLQGVAGVVDVLAGAGEMHEFAGEFQFGAGLELGLDPVLHRLDVVVGGLLDLLDRQRVRFARSCFTSPAGRCVRRATGA
jgi:hypothetical protein